jgi:hypothetical protein
MVQDAFPIPASHEVHAGIPLDEEAEELRKIGCRGGIDTPAGAALDLAAQLLRVHGTRLLAEWVLGHRPLYLRQRNGYKILFRR